MAERSIHLLVAMAGGKAVAMAFSLAAPVLVGRLLGPEGLGRWTLLVAAGTLLHTALVNWTHASTVRYGREEWVNAGTLNQTFRARLPFLVLSLSVALAVVFVEPGHWLARWFSAGSTNWIVAMFALSVWIASEAQATLQAIDRIMWQALLAPIVGLLSTVALVLLLVSHQRALPLAAAAVALPALVCWGAVWIYSLARSCTTPGWFSPRELSRQLRYGLPMLPTFAVGYFSDWGDHLLLTRFSSVTQVGLFGIAYQFMVAAMAANGMLITILLPRLISQEVVQPGYMRTYVAAEIPTLYALWMIATVWLVAVLPTVVGLLTGPGFVASIGLLLVLLVVIPSSVVSSLYTVLFNVQERTGHVFLYVLVMTLINIAVSIALIPTRGAVGAAIGTAVSYAVYQVLYVWDQHRQLGVSGVRTWTLTAVGLSFGLSQLALGPALPWRVVWACIATAVLVGIVRAVRCVDGALVERLFAGRLNPLAWVINRSLVAKT